MGLMVDTNVFIKFEKSGNHRLLILGERKKSSSASWSCPADGEPTALNTDEPTTQICIRRSRHFWVGVLDFNVAAARCPRNPCRAARREGAMIGGHDDHRGHGPFIFVIVD